jgi:hypothetical protein
MVPVEIMYRRKKIMFKLLFAYLKRELHSAYTPNSLSEWKKPSRFSSKNMDTRTQAESKEKNGI